MRYFKWIAPLLLFFLVITIRICWASITIETTKVQYSGSGTTGPFDFTFKIFAATDIQVIKTTSAGIDDLVLVKDVDYTIVGTGTPAYSTGGSVTLTEALAAGEILTIRRDMPYLQTQHYTHSSNFTASSLNNALDKLAIQIQQIKEEVDRSAQLPESSLLTTPYLPKPSAGKLLGWNMGESGLDNYEAVTGEVVLLGNTIPAWVTGTTQSAGDNSDLLSTTAYADHLVSNAAYDGSTWDAVTGIAPSKNAFRDYVEARIQVGANGTYGIYLGNNTTAFVPDSTYHYGLTYMDGMPQYIVNDALAPALTRQEVDGHAAVTLTSLQMSNSVIYNTGQAAEDVALGLPTCAAGLHGLFTVGTAQTNKWGVQAGASDKIYLIAADGTISAGADNGYARMTNAQVGQQFECWSFKTDAYDWACKAIAIGTSTFAAN